MRFLFKYFFLKFLILLLVSDTLVGQSSLNDLNVVFKHDFENNTLGKYLNNEWKADWLFPQWNTRVSESEIAQIANDPSNNTKSLKVNFPARSLGPDEGGVQWFTEINKQNELYISYDLYFMPGFEFQLGGKLPSVQGGSRTATVKPDGYDGFTGGLSFNKDGEIRFYLYFADQNTDIYGQSVIWGHNYDRYVFAPSKAEISYTTGSPVHCIPGTWNNITYRLVLNSVKPTGGGNYDGIIEGFFNGQLVIQVSNLLFRHTSEISIDCMRMYSFFGGSTDDFRNPIEEWLMVDNVILYTFKDNIDVPRGNTLSPIDRTINYWSMFSSLQVNPPQAPSSLTSTSLTKNSITLKWTDNSKNEAGFKIYRSASLDGTYTEIKSVTANVTNYTDNSLLPGTTYFYKILAYNNAGNSDYTSVISCATRPLQIPNSPSLLSTTNLTKSSISLKWTDNSNNESGFKIYRSLSASDGFMEIKTVAANTTTFNDSPLKPNTDYYYKVQAYNNDGLSPYSSVIKASTLPLEIPSVPSALIASQIGYTSAQLLWKDNSSNETNFELERSGPNNMTEKTIFTLATNKTEYLDLTLTINSRYQYRIRAKNEDGYSAWSNVIEVVTPLLLVPNAPTRLKSTEFTDKSISVVWNDNSNNEDAFIITRSLAMDPNIKQEFTIKPNDTIFTDTSLVSQTTYQYFVKARNAAGSSSLSNKNVATTLSKAELKRIKTGLIAYYNFGFNADYIVYDQSGFDEPLNLQVLNRSAVSWNKDNTIDILGNTALVSVEPAQKIIKAVRGTNEITFECWIKPAEPSFSDSRIVSLSSDDNHVGFLVNQLYNEDTYNKSISYGVRMQTLSTTESGYPEFFPGKTLNYLSLEHLVYVRDIMGIETFYLNGEKSKESFRPSDLSSWDDNFYLRLGNEKDMNHLWKGSYYSVAIYNKALSADQVKTNFKAGPCDSLNYEKFNFQILTYPNPIMDKAIIQIVPENLPDFVEHTYYRIIDMLGNVLYEENIFNPNYLYTQELDFSNYASGVYLLQVVSGKSQKSVKLVINR